jgi:3-oxoacyl-[acyl-carrier protein] reductase
MLLEGKNALVTGGSRGIGAGVVKSLLGAGASVWYVSRSQSAHHAAFAEIAASHGVSVQYVAADLGDPEAAEAAASLVVKDAGTVDALVNNAGITRDNLLFRMSVEQWDEVLDVNLRSAFLMSKVVVRAMARRRSGSVINVTSIVGQIGNGGQANYCAAKAGLIGLTKSMAREVSGRGVRVNAIAPGYIDTEMTQGLTEEQQALIKEQIPMGRVGSPEDVANVVLFLASDMSEYVTGQVIQVAGGLGM